MRVGNGGGEALKKAFKDVIDAGVVRCYYVNLITYLRNWKSGFLSINYEIINYSTIKNNKNGTFKITYN